MVTPTFFLIIYPANWEHAPISTFIIFSCFLLSDTADAYIYVFKYATVHRKLNGLLVQLPCCRVVQVEPSIPGANQDEVGRVNQDQIGGVNQGKIGGENQDETEGDNQDETEGVNQGKAEEVNQDMTTAFSQGKTKRVNHDKFGNNLRINNQQDKRKVVTWKV